MCVVSAEHVKHFAVNTDVLDEGNDSILPQNLGIQHMTFRCCHEMHKFFPALTNHTIDDGRTLTFLALCCLEEDRFDDIGKLLAEVGAGLTELTLCFDYAANVEFGQSPLVY